MVAVHHLGFCQTIFEMLRFFSIGSPPSSICLGYIWINHEENFAVSIIVQNFVAIGVGVYIYESFSIWRIWLENAYSRPQKWIFFFWVYLLKP